jgi:hypothetical protein
LLDAASRLGDYSSSECERNATRLLTDQVHPTPRAVGSRESLGDWDGYRSRMVVMLYERTTSQLSNAKNSTGPEIVNR